MQGFLRDKVRYDLADLIQCGCENTELGEILHRFEMKEKDAFRLFIKPLMDAWSWDQDRIDRCCTHVIRPDGMLDSFCKYYATGGGIICTFGRWPSVQVEIGFQIVAMICLWVLRRKHLLAGQHFHIYLIAYGLFRFGHEFLRATPKLFFGLSGYQLLGLATAGAAGLPYQKRARGSFKRV